MKILTSGTEVERLKCIRLNHHRHHHTATTTTTSFLTLFLSLTTTSFLTLGSFRIFDSQHSPPPHHSYSTSFSFIPTHHHDISLFPYHRLTTTTSFLLTTTTTSFLLTTTTTTSFLTLVSFRIFDSQHSGRLYRSQVAAILSSTTSLTPSLLIHYSSSYLTSTTSLTPSSFTVLPPTSFTFFLLRLQRHHPTSH